MARRESNEKIEFEKAVGLRGNWRSTTISVFKFVFAVLLLPLVVGLTRSFYSELIGQNEYIANNFSLGLISYLVLHIFVFELRGLYDFGQRAVGRLFNFFLPLRTLCYHCLPLYTIVIFAVYFVFKAFFGYDAVIRYFVFLISFSATMHLILTAANLKEDSLDAMRGNYFFSLFLVYIFEIILISGFLKFMLVDFSYINFIKCGFSFFSDTLLSCWQQLFVVE